MSRFNHATHAAEKQKWARATCKPHSLHVSQILNTGKRKKTNKPAAENMTVAAQNKSENFITNSDMLIILKDLELAMEGGEL